MNGDTTDSVQGADGAPVCAMRGVEEPNDPLQGAVGVLVGSMSVYLASRMPLPSYPPQKNAKQIQ